MSSSVERRWQETCRLFYELCDLDTATRRRRLAEIGDADMELRNAVESLLAADRIVDKQLARLERGIASVMHRKLLNPQPPPVDPLNLVGQSISHFRVIEPLAAGGMGVVYRAEDTQLQREVALKLPLSALQLDSQARSRFLREARAAGILDHPNICSVHEVGESESGQLFLAMPLYSGETLKSRIAREGALPLGDALSIARQVALGLAYAHAAGIVHRDLKPGNIMLLPDGTAKILDFGLAKSVDLSHTASGAILGTAGYMSPEQIRGRTVDARTDLWALGVVLFEMLTGERPFAGEDALAMAHAIVHEEAPRPSTRRTDLRRAVDELVIGLLQKEPAQRTATAKDLAASLAAIQRGAHELPRRTSYVAMLRARTRHFKVASVTGVLAFAALALVVLVAGLSIASRNERAETPLDANLIVVLPFRTVSTDTSFAVIGDGLVDLLATKLGGTIGPRAVDPHTTFAALRKWQKSTTELSRDSALLFASSLGAGLALSGSVVVTRRRIRISADLIEVSDGRVRGRAAVEGDVDSLTVLLDRLTSQVIGAELGESSERLAAFTSTSPEALHEYLRGRDALRRLYFPQAIDHFNRALRLDSTFALAAHYLVRAAYYFPPGTVAGSDRANRLACAAKDRVSPSERLRLIAFSVCPDVVPGSRNIFNPEFLAFLEKATATAPGDAELWARLGDYLFHVGASAPNWRARATTAFERALELNVPYLEALPHLIVLKAGDGDAASVRQLGSRLAREDTTAAWPVEAIWLPAALLGDTMTLQRLRRSRFAELMRTDAGNITTVIILSQTLGIRIEDGELAVHVLKQHADSVGNVATIGAALAHADRFALNAGRPARALTVERHIYNDVLRSDLADIMRVFQALFWDGDRTAAESKINGLLTLVGVVSRDTVTEKYIKPLARCALGLWFLARADTLRAKQHVSNTPDISADERMPHSMCRQTLNTELAFARGAQDRGAQLERLDSLIRIYPGLYWGSSATYVARSSQLVAARLFERTGQRERALAALYHEDQYAGRATIMLSSLLREEARLAALTGDTARAVRAYRHYLTLRSHPEPRLRPQIEQIRMELARLERGS